MMTKVSSFIGRVSVSIPPYSSSSFSSNKYNDDFQAMSIPLTVPPVSL
jgi:hypothetical protein